MTRTAARIALTASALLVAAGAAAPAASASSAYPPATPPATAPPATQAQPCTPVDGQDPNSTPPPGRESAPEVLASNLPWYCTPIVRSSASRTVPSLARTGAEVGTVGLAGLGLVVGGAALLRSSRRGDDAETPAPTA